MKTIKNLTVKVTYRVGLGNVEVTDDVFEQLDEIIENGASIDGMGSQQFEEATEWLRDTILERDCFELEYEIEDLDE